MIRCNQKVHQNRDKCLNGAIKVGANLDLNYLLRNSWSFLRASDYIVLADYLDTFVSCWPALPVLGQSLQSAYQLCDRAQGAPLFSLLCLLSPRAHGVLDCSGLLSPRARGVLDYILVCLT